MADPFVHLHVASGYSLQYGASPPQLLVERAVEHGPDNPNGWINFGHALRGLGRYQDARAAYERALARRPDDPTALVGLGYVLHAGGDIHQARGGGSGPQVTFPLMVGAAAERGLDLAAVSQWMAAGPARVAGLATKGRIAVGYDADLTVFDPDDETIVSARALHQRHSLTPYDGMRLAGRVREVVLAGEVTGRAGDPERGKLLRSGH